MTCLDVPIPDLQESECQPDEAFLNIEYWRFFPVDPPQENEKGEKGLAIAYDADGNERMRGEFWIKVSELGHFTLTPILPAFPA
jgi:hypothetical protein